MSSALPVQQGLPVKPLVGGKVAAHSVHQSGKHKPVGRACKQPHHNFWLAISTVAAQHQCQSTMLAQSSSALLSEASTASATDGLLALLIIGPGVLGSVLGKLWTESSADASAVGQTNTTANHHRLQQLGITPRLKAQAAEGQFANVVFSAPPSGCEDYVAEIQEALRLWDGTGTFLFTSSAGVFAVDDGTLCTEDSPVKAAGTSERTARLLKAEQAVLEAGGCVVRLAGLYHATRGPHTFFLKLGKVPRWPGYIVNLLHYEDAARLCFSILKHERSTKPFMRRLFLGTDGSPLTLQKMMEATIASGEYEGAAELIGAEGDSKGKLLCNDATRQALGWSPKYTGFESFVANGAQDFYKTSASF